MAFNLKWLLIFTASIAMLTMCGLLGMLNQLWRVDTSRISFVILGLFLLVSPFIGWLTWGRGDADRYTPACAYSAELMCELGLLGTVIGFLLMVDRAFTGLDLANVQATQKALVGLAAGMGVALTTTLVGIACAVLIKLQVLNLEASRA